MTKKKNYTKLITVLSVIIPLAIASLFRIKLDVKLPVFLPPIYASINALTAILLISAIVAIKNKKRILHERLIKTSMFLTLIFLLKNVHKKREKK